MATVDWIALGVVALAALGGLRRGLIGSALSVAGIVVGAIIGARLAPHFLGDGSRSPYAPLVALAGAAVGAILLQTVGGIAGSVVRGSLRLTPLRAVDSLGGLLLGAAGGLFFVWVVGAAALLLPGQTTLRRNVQESVVLQHLNDAVPPSRLLHLLARIDPLPSIAGPAPPAQPPDASVLRNPTVRARAASVVRILGTACGIGVEGSGWVARPGLVVTAAHVVAGQHRPVVQQPRSVRMLPAEPVAFDARNDIAVLRVPGLRAQPLRLVDPREGSAVAIVGYPANGPLTATPGRIGRTALVLSDDAYGRGPVPRMITSVRGRIRHGNSGGPAIDANGAVEATIFAARIGSESGFGIPASAVRHALDRVGAERVSTGGCV
ncbi:MAG TPA: MarP family serine protease [Gaiellaceae bacterium]